MHTIMNLPFSIVGLKTSDCVTEQDTAYSANDANDGNTNIQPDIDSCRYPARCPEALRVDVIR